MLSFIGIGLANARDISLNGLAAVHKADIVYVDVYTSALVDEGIRELEQLYHKNVRLATRDVLENSMQTLLDEAKEKNVALVIPGSPFAATTHYSIFVAAMRQEIPVQILDNASVFTSLGMTGLHLYRFGKTATIPFEHHDVKTPLDVLRENQSINSHTLLLLDYHEGKMMSVREGLDYLIKNGLSLTTLVVGCGGLGSGNQDIVVGKAKDVSAATFPQCIIIPAPELHFTEKEALDLW